MHLLFESAQYSNGWNFDDKKRNGLKYGFSRINFKPEGGACVDTEDGIIRVLDLMDKDPEGFKRIINSAESCISVHKQQYIDANAGIHLSAATINRLSDYGLSLDMDIYVVGAKVDPGEPREMG